MKGIDFCGAGAADLGPVCALLARFELPQEDLAALKDNFILALDEKGRLAGVVGLEPAGRTGLLRSLAVAPEWQGRGLGRELCARILALARSLGLGELFLLTMTAPEFFQNLGFSRLERDSAPAPIRATREFASLCPVTAVFMGLKLD